MWASSFIDPTARYFSYTCFRLLQKNLYFGFNSLFDLIPEIKEDVLRTIKLFNPMCLFSPSEETLTTTRWRICPTTRAASPPSPRVLQKSTFTALPSKSYKRERVVRFLTEECSLKTSQKSAARYFFHWCLNSAIFAKASQKWVSAQPTGWGLLKLWLT